MSKTIEEIKTDVINEVLKNGVGNLKEFTTEVAERYAQFKTKELQYWKESMMKVHSELDLQGIGTALELPLGSSIAPQVLPEIIWLTERNKELLEMLEDVKGYLGSDKRNEVDTLLTKHNRLNKKP